MALSVRERKTKRGIFRRKAKAGAAKRKTEALQRSIKGMTVKRLYLDMGGYADKGRKYFGLGAPIYRVWSADGDKMVEVRAHSALEAKEKALQSSTMRWG
jgi:hypothetical protein